MPKEKSHDFADDDDEKPRRRRRRDLDDDEDQGRQERPRGRRYSSEDRDASRFLSRDVDAVHDRREKEVYVRLAVAAVVVVLVVGFILIRMLIKR